MGGRSSVVWPYNGSGQCQSNEENVEAGFKPGNYSRAATGMSVTGLLRLIVIVVRAIVVKVNRQESAVRLT